MKYPKPKPFKPTAAQQKAAAEKVAKHFSKNKVLRTADGQKVRGKR